MKTLIMAVSLLLATTSFSQYSAEPDVKEKPEQKQIYTDTLVYVVIVYETPDNILKDVVMENEFLKLYLDDKKGVKVTYKKQYTGAAMVNEKYKDYVEVIELTIITY